MKKRLIIIGAIVLVAIFGFVAASIMIPQMASNLIVKAGEKAWKVMVNNKTSKLQPVKIGDKMYIPLNFPLEKGERSWEVNLKYDAKTKTLKIKKTCVQRKVRGNVKCSLCGGSGDCQACYPAGSGKNIQGDACPACDGTGDCMICNGQGSY